MQRLWRPEAADIPSGRARSRCHVSRRARELLAFPVRRSRSNGKVTAISFDFSVGKRTGKLAELGQNAISDPASYEASHAPGQNRKQSGSPAMPFDTYHRQRSLKQAKI
jgi:hypothetical protein